MLLTALAKRTPALAKARIQAAAGVFEYGYGSDQKAGEQRERNRKKYYPEVNSDFMNSREARWSYGNQYSQRNKCEHQSDYAAQNSEDNALKHQVRRDAAPARTQCGTDGKFLPPSFHPHQQKIGNIGACDKENDAN